jgi:hypothetical protein
MDMWDTEDKPTTYTFYVETETERIEWDGLTITRAKRMYAATQFNTPHNIKTYGWRANT